jgi:hypothetical protein
MRRTLRRPTREIDMSASAKLFVKLISSENTYISYPALGLLEILEFSTVGSIIAARFSEECNGKLGAAVQVVNPSFEFSREVAREGSAAVVELASRQVDHSAERTYVHQLFDKDTGRSIGQFDGRMRCEMFCSQQGIRIESYQCSSDSAIVMAYAFSTLVSDILADIYEIYLNNLGVDEADIEAKLVALGVNARQARNQVYQFKQLIKV